MNRPNHRYVRSMLAAAVVAAAVVGVNHGVRAQQAPDGPPRSQMRSTTMAQRKAAAERAAAARAEITRGRAGTLASAPQAQAIPPGLKMPAGCEGFMPTGYIDPASQAFLDTYMGGCVSHYANSPMPTAAGLVNGIQAYTGGIRKFVDTLPGLGSGAANNLGQYLPIAIPNTTSYPGSDYYEISLVEYTEKMHSDLPATRLRGYKQTNTTDATVSVPHYLGPIIISQKDRPTRIKFTNSLPVGAGGDLFIPTDTTTMGAGEGPGPDLDPLLRKNADGTVKREFYTQNRATLHLHGGNTPWISDGTPHQWVVPAAETTTYRQGASNSNVPDMPDPGAGSMTFYYTNQQSARLMFYHDHAYGVTRLNVYAGEAAGYLLQDPKEAELVASGIIPADQIPLIIQDKTFVPSLDALYWKDPTWDTTKWGGPGSLWFPHVYVPNQNPADLSGNNGMGRWDYGPWFWPPMSPADFTGMGLGEIDCNRATPGLGTKCPGTPNPSMVPEAFMDTALVNGTAYPSVTLAPKPYRFRILNASNDRSVNLQLYAADTTTRTADGRRFTEVKMVPAVATAGYPATWPSDGRAGGVPDPATKGPSWIQIGTEGGFLRAPVVIPPQPVNYIYNRRDIVVLNVSEHSLLLGPAERADVIVDFSQFAGKTLILYNDSGAPVPAFDPRYDYYTGNPDFTDTGGAPSTVVGYGPNTRTMMQVRVTGGAGSAYTHAPIDPVTGQPVPDATFTDALARAFDATQPALVVPPQTYSRIQDTSLKFTPAGESAARDIALQPKAIQELFELDYGRMNATMGIELPFTNFNTQTTIPLGYVDPLTETLIDAGTDISTGLQLWKITHNGVDTHAVHFHLFNVQLVNRVGWDGSVRPPEANEIGWKETVRMNPLEDAIVAMKPIAPELPFGVPNSVRWIDPTKPAGDGVRQTLAADVIDPATGAVITGVGATVMTPNAKYDFGWEYVWHCHLLGHEENDMMRPLKYSVTTAPPDPVGTLTASGTTGVGLTWTDPTPFTDALVQPPVRALGTQLLNPKNEIGYRVYRRAHIDPLDVAYTPFTIDPAITWSDPDPDPTHFVGAVLANKTTYADLSTTPDAQYDYRVTTYNASGNASSLITATAGKILPVLTWATPAPITWGTPLSSTQLNAVASFAGTPVPGTYAYTPSSGVLDVGPATLSVAFTPADLALFKPVTQTVALVVTRSPSGVTWATPAAIAYPTLLSATQLNASAAVPGTFVYNPVLSTRLNPGVQPLSATFTPTDSSHYASATVSVSLEVDGAATVTPTALAFHAIRSTANGAATVTTAAQTVQVTMATRRTWQASSNRNWLRLNTPGGQNPGTNVAGTGTGSFIADINPAALPTGTAAQTATITVSAGGGVPSFPMIVTLTFSADTVAPFGHLDTPTQSLLTAPGVWTPTYGGILSVTGWALDDVSVDHVELWRDRVCATAVCGPNEDPAGATTGAAANKVFIGRPTITCNTRPDVAALYSTYPNSTCAGWGIQVLTFALPNTGGKGTYTFTAIGYDIGGIQAVIGSPVVVVVDNSISTTPFGTIDTPVNDTTVTYSGQFYNFGWALTPPPLPGGKTCTIPVSVTAGAGTTLAPGVQVSIDNGLFYPVNYGAYRTDVAAAFPGYSNAYGAGGSYLVDTTTLADGSHTIGWSATDDCGRTGGMGSRPFIVNNSALLPAAALTVAAPAAVDPSSDAIDVSANGGAWQTILPAANGARIVQIEQGVSIQVRLPQVAGSFYAGYDVTTGTSSAALPIGSSLDSNTGAFSWVPGPSFLGAYDLLFTNTNSGSVKVRIIVGPPMRLVVDTPQAGATVEQPVVVAGWALDLGSAVGTGVDTVHVWAYPAQGGAAIFLGAAAYGDVRKDVGKAFGAQFEASSYGLTAAPSLAPGTYDVVVYAHRVATGTFDLAQKVRVEVR